MCLRLRKVWTSMHCMVTDPTRPDHRADGRLMFGDLGIDFDVVSLDHYPHVTKSSRPNVIPYQMTYVLLKLLTAVLLHE
jgi:hypothetical protein